MSSGRNREALWGLLLVALVILAYQSVWSAGFIWDDDTMLTANPCIVGPLGLKEIWTTQAADICPFTLTTLWAEHAMFGLSPLPYHLVNVLLHGGCAVLLWRVLRAQAIPGAWLGAALWALHPVQVESVAWIAEMKNTESGFFYLLSILFFVRGLKERKGWIYMACFLFAALAMASKTSTLVLPGVLLLCAWWREDFWRWRLLAQLVPITLLSCLAGALSLWTQSVRGAADPLWARSWPERLATAGDAVWFYLGKLLCPYPLIVVYPRWRIDDANPLSYLPLLGCLVVTITLWITRGFWARPHWFAWAYFLLALLPVLGLLNLAYSGHSFVADHFQYLAAMGPLALLAAGLAKGSELFFSVRSWMPAIGGAMILLLLGGMTWDRGLAYQNEDQLWSDTLRKNPNSFEALNYLGVQLNQRGALKEAASYFERAIAIEPSYLDAHTNLGAVFAEEGDWHGMAAQYQAALKINPWAVRAYENMGTALLSGGKAAQAVVQFKIAAQLNPRDATIHFNLARALALAGMLDEAIAEYRIVVQLQPDQFQAYNNLGNALLKQGRWDDAIEQYRIALRLDPAAAQIHYNLGLALVEAGRDAEAADEFKEVLQADPGNVKAKECLRKALSAASRNRSGK